MAAPATPDLQDTGEVRNVPVSRGERVMLDEAARKLEELADSPRTRAAAAELRVVAARWLEAALPPTTTEQEESA
jgi:hypothetical protein